MKKILVAIASLFVVMGSASASNVDKIEFANPGNLTLGIEVGIPPRTDNANMPFIGVDGMFGIANGFINTKTFGQNGGIDAGIQLGYTHWGDSWDKSVYVSGVDVSAEYKWRTWELPINLRAGFHFEFVKHLDVYAGLQGGVAIQHYRNKYSLNEDLPEAVEETVEDALDNMETSDTDVDGIFGMYIGAKWYFTDVFGVKVEYSGDWIGDDNNLSPFAVGVSFNF